MEQRRLGKTGAMVSGVGYGAWAIGSMWGPSDDEESRRALHHALDRGVTFIDTAQVYGEGHSESLIGEVLADRPGSARPFVATKLGPKHFIWDLDDDAELNDVFPADYIETSVDNSLRRLRTDALDLYQFHTWSTAFNARDEWKEAVRRIRQSGKVKHVGISAPNRGEECVVGALETGLIDSVQIIYNIFQARVARTVFPALQQNDCGLIVRVPLMEGALTGKFARETTFHEDDFRREYFGGNKLAATVERVEQLRAAAAEIVPGMPLVELALRFTLSHPAVSTVIPGIRSVAQAEANVKAGDGVHLTEAQRAVLATFEWDVDFWSLENV